MGPAPGALIYLLDDDDAHLRIVADLLRLHGFAAQVFQDPSALFLALRESLPAALVTDLDLGAGQMHGEEVVLQAKALAPHLLVIVLSAFAFTRNLPQADVVLAKDSEAPARLLAVLKDKTGAKGIGR